MIKPSCMREVKNKGRTELYISDHVQEYMAWNSLCKGWSIRFGGRGVCVCVCVCVFKKKMQKDTVRKKKHSSAYRSQKNTCKGMMSIYIIYVNLGKTGFVERSRKF